MYMCTHSTSINNVYMRSVCTCRETANVSKFGSRLGTGSTCMESLSLFCYHTTCHNMHTKEGVHTFVRICKLSFVLELCTSKET